MQHPDNHALVRYWHALRAGRRCPRRTEIDPRRIDADMGYLFILEDLGRDNIRFRLAGSALVDAFWMELRGMPAHAIMAPEARGALRDLARETLAGSSIGEARLAPAAGGPGADWEIVLLPLRSEQGEIDRLIGALRPLDAEAGLATEPPLQFTMAAVSVTPVFGEGGAALAADDRLAVGGAVAARRVAGRAGDRPVLHTIEGSGPRASAAAPPRLRVIDGGA